MNKKMFLNIVEYLKKLPNDRTNIPHLYCSWLHLTNLIF